MTVNTGPATIRQVVTPDAETHAGIRREHGSQLPRAALWRVRQYLRPYYRQILIMLVAALLGAGAEIVIPLLTKKAIDGPIATSASTPGHGHGLLVPIGLAAIGLGIAEVALNLLRRWAQGTAVAGLEQSMRDEIYQHLQRLEPAFHDQWQSGQLLSRATTDLSAIRRFFSFGIVFMITSSASFIAIVVLLIRLNLLLGLLTAAVFAPVTALCLWFERRYSVLSRRVQDQQDDLATCVEEAAAGIRVIKALGRRDHSVAIHSRLARNVYETQLSKARLRGAFWASLDLVPNVAIAAILLIGALAVASGSLTTGGLVAFVALVLQLVWPIEAMGYVLASAQEAATAAQRVFELFDAPPAITDHGAAVPGHARAPGPARAAGPARAPGQARAPGARLEFQGVAFGHPGAGRRVLTGVTLVLEPGTTVALAGATGSGKTTLLQLVPRLADVTAGSIRLDGADIRSLPLDVLRSRVACAFEEATLFSASVRENVTFGAPGASDQDIAAALGAAQAGFAYDLPWGLDTRIGEQGMSLSGGQRQRIALARAILARPGVLLLDDPLSAVDVQTEAMATRALHRVLADTTALVVAHRPSTVALADTVALLDGGVITAVGTHAELVESEPAYRDLMTMTGTQVST